MGNFEKEREKIAEPGSVFISHRSDMASVPFTNRHKVPGGLHSVWISLGPVKHNPRKKQPQSTKKKDIHKSIMAFVQ